MINGQNKQKIRTRYKGICPSELEVIPAVATDEIALEHRKLRVAGYVRVSTENDEQTSSYELQYNDFIDRINANPNWELVGIYSDEGISGTELSHRKGMLQMIEDARAGKIDHILAKSIARFARNVVDCLSIIEELKKLGVGVHFDENNLYTLDATGSLVLTILATVAEEESRSKSFIMNWSIERRFSKGIFLTPQLLGYDLDKDGNLVVNPEEAETVKVIYNLYINGWSPARIAKLLTDYGRKTKLGNESWKSESINGVIENERHCGDIRARKTYTPDFKTHKAEKNRQNRKQYIQRNHHEPIVDRDVFNAANLMKSSRIYASKKRPLPLLSVIDNGILSGYVPIDKDWNGFSKEEYQLACDSISSASDDNITSDTNHFIEGYQVIRADYFPSKDHPTLTIDKGKLRFNTVCLKKFEDVEYVELLLNTKKNCIAIRPCEKDNPNAIHWGRLREDRWVVSTLSCKGLIRTLFDMMSWEDGGQYKFRGEFKIQGNNKLLFFELGEPVITKTVEQIVIPDESDNQELEHEEFVIREKVRINPPTWTTSLGISVSCLEQHHYAGDWDILRPAKELKELNKITTNRLNELMREAECIVKGWKIA